MNCPKCGFEIMGTGFECERCGLILSKYKKTTGVDSSILSNRAEGIKDDETMDDDDDSLVMNLLFYVKPQVDSVEFGLRSLCFTVFFFWGVSFILSSVNNPGFGAGFWHLVNLPFHEAGHIIFRPFGRVVTSLGGTLGQLLMPLVCLVVFLIKTRDTFAAGFCLWWMGENFMDISPYIDDARSLTMPLLGGNTGETSPYGFHDWEFILTETGLLKYDHMLARLSHGFGTVLILLAFLWWGMILYKYNKNLEP